MEEQLFQAAKILMVTRYPTGSRGGAALATLSGKISTSVAPETKNNTLSLCTDE
ncbi:hypothetical protein F991_03431 [Acinetobacter sp. CIP-A165]|uniref:hypothetical protein n=1 Tax=Acinetobacter sp. CIP-A165 TaxID=40373 RepID=UPI0002D0E878|nr:hypothetical protein [Acinetobacter sp. CIP-A165]ENU28849.1 hypothetical protein F991_03431 [Acinetobacter sp. CIP-A165]